MSLSAAVVPTSPQASPFANEGTSEVTREAAETSPPTPQACLLPIRFGEFLCERSLITDEQLLDALGDHWVNGGKIGVAIARRGFLSAVVIEQQAALYHGLDVIEI